MTFSVLLPKMQAPEKGDALSPRPTNCILRTRSNEENTADAGLVVAAGRGASPNVANRRSSLCPGQEQIHGGLRSRPEGGGKPHRRSTGGQLAKGQLLRVVGS